MKKIAPIILIALAVAGYFIFSSAGLRPAPEVSMTTLQGHNIDTLNRNNKPLLVTFWATTCSSCVKEMPHLVELQQYYSELIDIAGVAMYYDNVDHVKELVKRKNLNYHIVTDVTGKISEAFGSVRITPTSFLISADGQIIYQKIGDIDFEKIKLNLKQKSAETTHAVG